jgi:tetratricopeptide (TPR) repeat protein
MSQKWAAFPYQHASFLYDVEGLRQNWSRLHGCDAEPFPRKPALIDAWRLFHAGEFQAAHEAGISAAEAGSYAGLTVANKAQAIYAHYVERKDKKRLELFQSVAERAVRHQALDPEAPNAYYWQAYALGRYAQSVGVAKGLGQGLGPKILSALGMTIELAPKHADAHMVLGTFHAEVIDKLGRLLARTQGADTATGIAMYQRVLSLNPHSPIAMIERANGLLKLEGEKRRQEAETLYVDAAAAEPKDALECFAVELARDRLDE